MTKLAIFLFGYNEAQTIQNRPIDCDHWYMASCICGLLGITGYSQVVHKYLYDYEWRKESIHIGGYGKKNILLVSTIGMLKLIVRGRTPYAHRVCDRIFKVPVNLRVDDWPTKIED